VIFFTKALTLKRYGVVCIFFCKDRVFGNVTVTVTQCHFSLIQFLFYIRLKESILQNNLCNAQLHKQRVNDPKDGVLVHQHFS